jgi:hypothetical protein
MTIERKYERDMDVFLAEEFSVSPKFASWFLSKSKFIECAGEVCEVFVSRSNNLGESDLIVVYSVAVGRRVALLIEDKIDAQVQPSQAERYRQRAALEVKKKTFDDFEIVICAPEGYAGVHPEIAEFDRFISYEEISASISEIDASKRGQYRAAFVRTAAKRRQNKWERNPDADTDRFWDAVYRLASQEFPILEMKRPQMTKNSNWITLRPLSMPTMPKYVYVSLKGSVGPRERKSCCVDLTFGKTIAHQFDSEIHRLLVDGMSIHQTSSAAAIRIELPQFKVEEGPEAALPKVRAALDAAKQLIEFYKRNKDALDAAALNATSV